MTLPIEDVMAFIDGPFDAIEGMCFKDSAAFTIYLIDRFFEGDEGCGEAAVEIGVWKGRYLASIYKGTERLGVPVHAVDFFAWAAKEHHVVENFDRAFGGHDRLVVNTVDSTTIDKTDMAALLGGRKIMFASIDGAHKRGPVINDLDNVYAHLSEHGLISVDDFQYYPAIEVADGFYEWWWTREHDLAPFSYCTNKLFLCRKPMRERAYEIALAWADREGTESLPSVRLSRANARWRTDMDLMGHRIVHLHDIAT